MVVYFVLFFCFKQKTAYEMLISDWSSDVCSSDLLCALPARYQPGARSAGPYSRCDRQHDADARWQVASPSRRQDLEPQQHHRRDLPQLPADGAREDRQHCRRSEEHTSELQSLMRISYAVFCLKKKKERRKTNDRTKHNLKKSI